MAQKPQKFGPGQKILRIDRKEIQFAIEGRNHKRQLSQSMETQSTPVAPDDSNPPALTDQGIHHATSTDFSANDSSIFNLSDLSLSTFRNTPSAQHPSGPVIYEEVQQHKGNIFLDEGCNLEEVGASPGSSPDKDYLAIQKRTALNLKKKGVHTVKDLEASSNELSESLIYDPSNKLQEEEMLKKLKRHSNNLSPSKQDALDLSLGNFTDQPIVEGDKEQVEESKREDKEEASIYNPERRLIETPLQIREEQRVLKFEQQKMKNEMKRSAGFEAEMTKEMNHLRSRLREVMRENQELRDNVRYLKEEKRDREEEEEEEGRKPSISKEERDECKSSMIDLRSNIAKIAEQLDQQANFLLQNKDRFDTSEITVMTELSRLISARSAKDPTIDLILQQKKLTEQLERREQELREKEQEIVRLVTQRAEFQSRHDNILIELNQLKSDFQALLELKSGTSQISGRPSSRRREETRDQINQTQVINEHISECSGVSQNFVSLYDLPLSKPESLKKSKEVNKSKESSNGPSTKRSKRSGQSNSSDIKPLMKALSKVTEANRVFVVMDQKGRVWEIRCQDYEDEEDSSLQESSRFSQTLVSEERKTPQTQPVQRALQQTKVTITTQPSSADSSVQSSPFKTTLQYEAKSKKQGVSNQVLYPNNSNSNISAVTIIEDEELDVEEDSSQNLKSRHVVIDLEASRSSKKISENESEERKKTAMAIHQKYNNFMSEESDRGHHRIPSQSLHQEPNEVLDNKVPLLSTTLPAKPKMGFLDFAQQLQMHLQDPEFISRMRTEPDYDKSMSVHNLEELMDIQDMSISQIEKKFAESQEEIESIPSKRRQSSKMSEVEGIFEAAYHNTDSQKDSASKAKDYLSGRSEWTNADLTYSQDEAATPKTLKQ